MPHILTPERYHSNEEINELVAGYACAGFHPRSCIPHGYHRPISEWTITEFVRHINEHYGSPIGVGVTISLNWMPHVKPFNTKANPTAAVPATDSPPPAEQLRGLLAHP